MLHGLGDTNASFTKLGQQLNLPETACIAVQAPAPLPFDLGGFHWGDDMLFDQRTGEMEVDTGFQAALRHVLEAVVRDGLIHRCGYTARELVVFGFGQGGMVGLQVAAEMADEELGGVISVGGVLPSGLSLKARAKKNPTAVLVCKAARGSAVTESAVMTLRHVFASVEMSEWARTGDAMPSSRVEMLPIMQFLARRLRSTRGVPAGSVELS